MPQFNTKYVVVYTGGIQKSGRVLPQGTEVPTGFLTQAELDGYLAGGLIEREVTQVPDTPTPEDKAFTESKPKRKPRARLNTKSAGS